MDIVRPEKYLNNEVVFRFNLANESWDEMQWIADRCPNVDTVVNCAGLPSIRYFEDLEDGDVETVLDVNLRSIHMMVRTWFQHLRSSEGTVLNVLSSAARKPMTASYAYNVSKAGAEMATRQLARELTRRHGISVIGVSPVKMIGTEMTYDVEHLVPIVRNWSPSDVVKHRREETLRGVGVQPSNVAKLIAFILSNEEMRKEMSGSVLEYGA